VSNENDKGGGATSALLTEEPADAESRDGIGRLVDEALVASVGGEGATVNAARALPEPAVDRVDPEVLERAALAASSLPRTVAAKHQAVILDRLSPTKFRVGVVNEFDVNGRKAVARALATTTQFIEFRPLSEAQFRRILAYAYAGQSEQDANALAEARERRDWIVTPTAGGTAADIESGTVSFVTGERLAEVTRTKVVDLTNVEELKRLARLQFDSLAIQDFTKLSLYYFIESKASDYFLEASRRTGGRIRYNIDDVPHEKFRFIPLDKTARIARAIAQMADVDSSEMDRSTQDAMITVLVSRNGRQEEVELRFSSMPCKPLSEITLRSQSEVITDINKLGFLKPHYAQVRAAANMTQGIYLVTGPTGSGKTNTLAAILEEIGALGNRRIISMEDPIEVYSETRSQMPITSTNTWEQGFHAMLRSAPKICVVGELRSKQAISVALEAATTGHLVFATFHTSNVETTFARLLKAGFHPEQLADSLVCVQSQRLVRTLCSCKLKDDVESEAHGRDLYMPNGCPKCFGIGFKGRTSLPEILVVDAEVQDALAEGVHYREVVRAAVRTRRMLPMRQVARAKVLAGLTTFAEVDRVASFAEAKSNAQGSEWEAESRRARTAGPSAAADGGAPAPADYVDADYEMVEDESGDGAGSPTASPSNGVDDESPLDI
jgi:type II secretory ATPase GspE/PulE/Tfp pilus assembly ATPase PilB-like protein